MPTEDEKRRGRGHAVGLFRYQLICPALDKDLSTKARGPGRSVSLARCAALTASGVEMLACALGR